MASRTTSGRISVGAEQVAEVYELEREDDGHRHCDIGFYWQIAAKISPAQSRIE